MTMMSMMLMTVLGLSLVFSASNENLSSNSETLANQAYYAAEAGLDEALMIMRGNRPPLGVTTPSTTDPLHQINFGIAATKSSSNTAAENATTAVTYARLSRWLLYSSPTDSGAVVLNPGDPANKQLSYQLRIEKVSGTEEVQITSTGIAPQGARRTLKLRVMDVEAFINGNNLPYIPAAVTLLGNDPEATVGSSAATNLFGNDCGPTGTSEHPIFGAVGPQNAKHAWDHSLIGNNKDVYNTTYDNYNKPSGIVADISVPDPAYGITGQVPFDNNQVKADRFVKQVAKIADRVVNAGESIQLGTQDASKVILAKGDLSLTGEGSGVLVVTGNLTMSGNFKFNGLIIVLGTGGVQRNGGGNGEIKGGIIIAKYNSTTVVDSIFNDDAYLATNGGGNSKIIYCSASIQTALDSLKNAALKATFH